MDTDFYTEDMFFIDTASPDYIDKMLDEFECNEEFLKEDLKNTVEELINKDHSKEEELALLSDIIEFASRLKALCQ